MLKKTIILFVFIALAVLSCKKHEMAESKFAVTLTQKSNASQLSWDAVTLSNFKNISIYRSDSPIPNPSFGKSIDVALLITTINDKTVTNFSDSTFKINSTGEVYYKLVLNFGDRFLVSDLLKANFNGFSLIIASGSFSSNYSIARLPQINKLYIANTQGVVSIVDYGQKKVLLTSSIINANGKILAIMNGNNPELFIINGSSIYCYDGLNLSLKYTLPISSSVRDFCVKNNRLYVLTNNYSIKTFDLNTKAILNEKYLTLSGSIYRSGIFSGSLSSALYLHIYYGYYNSSAGASFYKNEVRSFSLSGGIPVDSSYLSIPALNLDSSQQSNFNGILMSPDGKYLTCNQNGDIYSFYDYAVHSIRSSSNPTCFPSYSSDGKYIVGRPYIINGGNTVDVYSLPGFNLVTSVKSPIILNTFNATQNDFTDNDTLVSHSVTQAFQSNSTVATLNVFFKKLN